MGAKSPDVACAALTRAMEETLRHALHEQHMSCRTRSQETSPHALAPLVTSLERRVERDVSNVASIEGVAAQASSGELAPIVRPQRSPHHRDMRRFN